MKKVLIWGSVIATILYLSTKATAAEAQPSPNVSPFKPDYGPLEGKAVKVAGSTTLYLVQMGKKVQFVSPQAYTAYGSPQIAEITQTAFDNMPEVTNKKVYDDGKIRQL